MCRPPAMIVHTAYLQWWSVFLPYILTAIPPAPANLTLDGIFDNSAVVVWEADTDEDIVGFEMIVRPLLSATLQEIRERLDGQRRSVLVQPLYPGTEYQLYISSRTIDGTSNMSDVITFRTLDGGAWQPDVGEAYIKPGEAAVVVFILVAWMCAVATFLHKWGKIRILHSPESRYNHTPKNLHTIKVVKRSTDSVIYKNYTKEHSTTMIARQKRLERMHTMPNIKINASDILAANQESSDEDRKKDEKSKRVKHKHKVFSRMMTSPVIELEEPDSSSA